MRFIIKLRMYAMARDTISDKHTERDIFRNIEQKNPFSDDFKIIYLGLSNLTD